MTTNEINELEMLSALIENIQGIDNSLRKQSEDLFNQIKEQNPDKFTICLLNLAKASPKTVVRQFSVIMLRKNLSAFSEKSFSPLWVKLSQDTQKIVKAELFGILQNESVKAIRHFLCDLIGELGGTIINLDEEEGKDSKEAREWPTLLNHIFEFYVQGNDVLKESALRILTTFFTFANDEFKEYKTQLYSIFKSAIEHADIDIKLAGIQAMGSYIEICDPKDAKSFEDLLPSLLNNTIFLLGKDESKGSDAMGVLVDIAEAEPKFYKKSFTSLFEAMSKIAKVKQMEEEGIRQLAIEIVISVVERLPKLVRDNAQSMHNLLEMIFTYMVEIENTIEESWSKPPEGFNDDFNDDEDNTAIKYGMHVIDRLIAGIGEKKVIPNLSEIIHAMLSNSQDWRYKHAALMALSQVGEYVDDLNQIEPIVKFVVTFFQDQHPKIRYAALHCIGQICDDMQPEFQTRFHEVIIPSLLTTATDQVPRVSAHALAALTNFLEGATSSVVIKYMEPILNVAFEYVQNGISLVKENAMSTIAATAESAKEHYRPYFDKSVPILYSILTTHIDKAYKQLRGQTIETLTLMGNAVGAEYFKKYADQIITTMIQIQEHNVDEIDPQKSYLLSGWQRLCVILGDDLIPYLERLIPSVFKVVSSVLRKDEKKVEESSTPSLLDMMGESEKTNDKTKEKKIEINTYETEEVEIAINMLNVFINELKNAFLPYLEPAIQLLLPMCNYTSSEKIRKSAAKCLPGILIIVQQSQSPNKDALLVTMTHMFIATLWTSITTEYDADVITMQIYCIKECIDTVGKFMTEKDLGELSERILHCLKESDQRKGENEKMKQEEDVEEEEVELLNDDNDKEEELHVALAELIGVLFKTHKEMTLPLVDILYNEVLTKVLQPSLSDKMHKFGIFLIDDMIEHLGIELIPNIWPALSEALLLFATDKSPLVRSPALYGIGVLAEKSKEIFALMSELCIAKIIQALNIPMAPETPTKIYGHCKDNGVSALGKIIKNHSDKIQNIQEVVNFWLNSLPLSHDKDEAKVAHDFFAELLLYGNSSMWAGSSGENMPQIVKILVDIVDTKRVTEDTNKKVVAVIKLLATDEKTQTVFANVVNAMSNDLKKKVQAALSAQ